MGKFLLSTLLLLTTAFASTAAEETWVYAVADDYTNPSWLTMIKSTNGIGEITATSGTASEKSISWSYKSTGDATTINKNGTNPKGITMGSASKPFSTVTFSTTALSSKKITKVVVVIASISKKCSYSVNLQNGDFNETKENVLYQNNSGSSDTPGTAEFIPNSTGSELSFTITQTGTTTNTKGGFKFCSVSITYEEGTIVSPDKCATPVAKVGEKVVVGNDKLFVNDELTFSCSTEGATITYSLIGGEYNIDNEVFNGNPIKFNKAALYTIKAKATVDGKDASDELVIEDIDVVKRNADISFAKSTATAYLDAISEFTAPELSNPNNLKGITYTSSNPEIATVAADGTVAPLAAGETTITAVFAGNEEYEGIEAEYVLTIEAVKPLMEEIVINEFFEDVTSQTYTQYSKESDFADYITIVSLSGSNSNWNIGNSNLGKNSGLIVKSQKGYYPVKITVESNYSNNNTFNVYASDSELTLSSLKDCKEISALTTDNRTYNFTRDFAYIGLRPSVEKTVTINKITIVYAPRPEAPVFAEGHGIDENGLLSTSDESKDLFFVPMENAEIYYRLTAKPAANALAEEATDEIHGDFKKLEDHTQAINVTKNDSSLEYYSYVNGVKSNVNKVSLDLGNVQSGVAEIEAAGTSEVRWFDMQGREVKGQPEKGIYVRVVNGKASKVIL